MPTPELDLDALEREGRPEPMTVRVRGKQFVTRDPLMLGFSEFQAVDWSDNDQILQALFAPDDLADFQALNLSQHAMNILGGRLSSHYFPDDSLGEGNAS